MRHCKSQKTKQSMKNKLVLFALVAISALLTSCGRRVEVPPAHVGLVKTADGIQEEVHQPSSFRLPFSMMVKNQLILVETSQFVMTEKLKVFMPRDKLNFDFEIRGTFAVSPDSARTVADKITADTNEDKDHILYIDADNVYEQFAKNTIRTRAAAMVAADYGIIDVMSNLDNVSTQLFAAVEKSLEGTPVKLLQLAIADPQPPQIIVQAQENAKEREIAIEKAESDKLVALKNIEADHEVAQKQQLIDLLEAETQVKVELKLNESVSESYMRQKGLKILDKWGDSDNKILVLPNEVFSNPALLLGMTQEALKDIKNNKE